MRYSHRLFLYTPLFVLLALAIAAGLHWQAVVGELEFWLRQHNGREIAPGVTLQFSSESVSGFPFNADAVLKNVTIRVKMARTSGSWHTDAFAIHELTYGRAQQIYEAAGIQTVSWSDPQGGQHRLSFVPGSLRASSILSHDRLVRFDLDINGIGSHEISGARLQLHFRKSPSRNALDIAASADDFHFAPPLQSGFGSIVRHANIEADLVPAAFFVALFEGRQSWDGALEAWRQGGGTFHLGNLEIAWNAVQIHASGKLGLDGQHRPQGILAIDVDGEMSGTGAQTADGRLALAIKRLIKVANEPPQRLSIHVASGAVNLGVTKAPHIMAGTGSLGPLY